LHGGYSFAGKMPSSAFVISGVVGVVSQAECNEGNGKLAYRKGRIGLSEGLERWKRGALTLVHIYEGCKVINCSTTTFVAGISRPAGATF
jgi:hypothetical protein